MYSTSEEEEGDRTNGKGNKKEGGFSNGQI